MLKSGGVLITEERNGQKQGNTVRLIKKETTFILILQSLNSKSHIVIYERFKKL